MQGLIPEGKTYKLTDFLATDWQMWEQNESDPFFFNDAGNNEESIGETVSLRHSGVPNWTKLNVSASKDLPGGAVIGMFGGTAQFVKWKLCHDLVAGKATAPNDILNGPAYRKR